MDADFLLNQASGFVVGVVSSSAYSLIGKQVDRWRIYRDERIGGISPLVFSRASPPAAGPSSRVSSTARV